MVRHQGEIGHGSGHRKLEEDFCTAEVACLSESKLNETSDTMFCDDPFHVETAEQSRTLKISGLLHKGFVFMDGYGAEGCLGSYAPLSQGAGATLGLGKGELLSLEEGTSFGLYCPCEPTAGGASCGQVTCE